MNRKLKIYKKGSVTCVDEIINGNTINISSNKNRSLVIVSGGVKVLPNENENVFNNLTFLISELVDDFGAKTPLELRNIFIDKMFFSTSKRNKTIIEIPKFIVLRNMLTSQEENHVDYFDGFLLENFTVNNSIVIKFEIIYLENYIDEENVEIISRQHPTVVLSNTKLSKVVSFNLNQEHLNYRGLIRSNVNFNKLHGEIDSNKSFQIKATIVSISNNVLPDTKEITYTKTTTDTIIDYN